jgi:hypothetical protein
MFGSKHVCLSIGGILADQRPDEQKECTQAGHLLRIFCTVAFHSLTNMSTYTWSKLRSLQGYGAHVHKLAPTLAPRAQVQLRCGISSRNSVKSMTLTATSTMGKGQPREKAIRAECRTVPNRASCCPPPSVHVQPQALLLSVLTLLGRLPAAVASLQSLWR